MLLFLPNRTRVDSTQLASWPGAGASRFSHTLRSIYLIKRDVYKIDSSSKRGGLLWIRGIFFTGSRVYACFDVLNKPCIALAPKVYRFCAVRIRRASAHSLLWICMGLSTAVKPGKCLLARSQELADRRDGSRYVWFRQTCRVRMDLTQGANSSKAFEKKIFAHLCPAPFRFTTKIGIQG